METKTFTFDMPYNFKWFTVNFESDKPGRDRIMDVILDGYKLDVPDLRTDHPVLYQTICDRMKETSNDYWLIEDVPTLARQPKKRIPSFFIYTLFFMMLIPALLHAQDQAPKNFGIFSSHLEYSLKYNKVGGVFDGGYRFGNHYAGANTHIYFTNKRSTPIEVDMEYGYNIGSFMPFISGGYYTCGGEAVKAGEGTQGFSYGGGLSYFPVWIPIRLTVGVSSSNTYFSVGIYRAL